MMVSAHRVSHTPRLPLELSFSPLLAGIPSGSPRLSRSERTESAHSSPGLPLFTCPTPKAKPPVRAHPPRSKQLPAIPTFSTPSHSPVVNLLNLLDRMDNDISCELLRVRENIRDTRALVKEVKNEQRLRSSESMARRDQQSGQTKDVHGDFWLGV